MYVCMYVCMHSWIPVCVYDVNVRIHAWIYSCVYLYHICMHYGWCGQCIFYHTLCAYMLWRICLTRPRKNLVSILDRREENGLTEEYESAVSRIENLRLHSICMYTIWCDAIRCHVNAVLCCKLQQDAMQYNRISYDAIQQDAMQYNNMSYNTIQCNRSWCHATH